MDREHTEFVRNLTANPIGESDATKVKLDESAECAPMNYLFSGSFCQGSDGVFYITIDQSAHMYDRKGVPFSTFSKLIESNLVPRPVLDKTYDSVPLPFLFYFIWYESEIDYKTRIDVTPVGEPTFSVYGDNASKALSALARRFAQEYARRNSELVTELVSALAEAANA